uniref:Uncharacterized protein n=1 Tax=Tanacetum cinerariifolium TaxID=118510 RepID=A0A6L2L4V8_TANCI|nr:hypothetical protein [Tanacetum cinerariifolium]
MDENANSIVVGAVVWAGRQANPMAPPITIYGSDLLILSSYAPSMPPLLLLSLFIVCGDSDGLRQRCLTFTAFPSFLPHSPILNEEATNRVDSGFRCSRIM